MFENLKLRNRILLGYSAPIGLALIVAGAVFVGVGNVRRLSDSVQDANDILQDSTNLAWNISDLQKFGRAYLLQKTDATRERYLKTVAELAKVSESLSQDVKDPVQKKQLEAIFKLDNEVRVYNDQLIAQVDAGNANAAIATWRLGEGRRLAGELETLVEKFLESEREILQERRAARAAGLNLLTATVVIGALLTAAVSILLAYLISNAIAKQVRDSANMVASSANEIAATLEQQERTITQQSASVNETTTTVEELGASSRQSAEQADTSAAGAKEALAVTGDGLKAVEQTAEGLNNLKEKVRAIAEQIMRLSEQTGQISGVTAVVADIANQTNMLALNAAVEAARAGEQGKGFAVVASEIRKLADESKKSAERIYQLVSDVQAAMNSTVMVTDEGTKTADASIRLAQGTADAFNTVSEAINSVFLNNQQIALGSKQQAVGVQQVVSAMNAINLGAKESAAGVTQVKTATGQLNSAAKDLLNLV